MSKVNKDDIGAICARIDAQTRIFIEVMADCYMSKELMVIFISHYTNKYNRLVKKYRRIK